jgi:hypothetical protein
LDSWILTFNHPVELGVDSCELLVVQFNRSPQLADFSIHLVDFLLQLRNIRPSFPAKPAYFVFQAQHLIRELAPASLTQRFAYGLVNGCDRQRLRMALRLASTPCSAIEKLFYLVPTRNQQEKTSYPGREFH